MEDINNSYLSFKVGAEFFAVHASRVEEIREYQEPRHMPEVTTFMKGVIDHRDEIIPVIDTGLKFGMKPIEVTMQTCIVIINVKRKDSDTTFKVGILTDSVTDVFEAEMKDFKSVEIDYSPEYIQATYQLDDSFYLVLNLDEVFSKNEIVELSNILREIKK